MINGALTSDDRPETRRCIWCVQSLSGRCNACFQDERLRNLNGALVMSNLVK